MGDYVAELVLVELNIRADGRGGGLLFAALLGFLGRGRGSMVLWIICRGLGFGKGIDLLEKIIEREGC